MKLKGEIKQCLHIPHSQMLNKCMTVTNILADKGIIDPLRNKEEFIRRRATDMKESQLVSSISASNLRETSKIFRNINPFLFKKKTEQHESHPSFAKQDDTKRSEELKIIAKRLLLLIGVIQENSKDTLMKCKEIWEELGLTSIINDDKSDDNAKETMRNTWLLFYFSLIFCYDIENNIRNENVNNNHNEKEYLRQVKNGLTLNYKIIELLLFYHSSLLLSAKDLNRLVISIKSLMTSICSIHKTCLIYYTIQKDNGISSLWKKIPYVTYATLDELFKQIIQRKETKMQQQHQQFQSNILTEHTKPIIPYLPKEGTKHYTLVLDLDETLVHCINDPNQINQGTIKYRPDLHLFLENLLPYYELVLFTMGLPDYADVILDSIEQNRKYFQYRLYRHHTIPHNNHKIKDLRYLGRDLNSIILVDDKEINFIQQKENGILIKPFMGNNPKDTALIDLLPILIKIAKDNMDVREGLNKYKNIISQNVSENSIKYIHR